MDYRVRYRDIPWGVALGVLPGKIIGAMLIDPVMNFRRNWKRRLRNWIKNLLILLIILLVIAFGSVLANHLTDGTFSSWLLHIYNSITGSAVAIPEVGNIP